VPVTSVDFGLSTHLFHAETLTPGHFDTVAAQGFSAIEVFATRSHFDYHDESQARGLARWCAESGLRLHSLHAPITEFLRGTTWGPSFSTGAANQTARERALDECRRALAVAAHAPYHYLVVHLGVPDAVAPPRGDNHRDAVLRSVDVLRHAAADVQVQIAVEVIPNRLSTAEQLVRLIEDEDFDDVGICLDVGHARMLGDVADAIEAVAGYLVTTHVHDNRGRTDDHLAPFDGVIDWPATLMGFQKIGYTGTLMFEVAAAPDGTAATLARAAQARARMQAILGDELVFAE
jgi:sugar phosphate isomerase/epimerase